MEPVKLKLRVPVRLTTDGEEVSTLVFREPEAADWEGFPIGREQTVADVIAVASRLCGQPRALLRKLKTADMWEVVSIVSGFIGGGPADGSAPSR